MICGAANHQLLTAGDDERLRQKGVLYCPDYLVNAGGLISVARPPLGMGEAEAAKLLAKLPNTLGEVDEAAALSGLAGIEAAAYFIDADHAAAPGAWPRGGLTILRFRNNHLTYALTWYAMALFFFAAMAWVIWDRVRSGRRRLRLGQKSP